MFVSVRLFTHPFKSAASKSPHYLKSHWIALLTYLTKSHVSLYCGAFYISTYLQPENVGILGKSYEEHTTDRRGHE